MLKTQAPALSVAVSLPQIARAAGVSQEQTPIQAAAVAAARPNVDHSRIIEIDLALVERSLYDISKWISSKKYTVATTS